MSCSSREDIAEIGHLTITKKGQKTMSKERLVELIGNVPIGVNGITLLDKHEPKVIEEVADYLLASGEVIVPPCKVGQTLYFLYDGTFANRPDFTPYIYETNDWYFDIDKKGISILPRSIRSYKGKHHYYLGKTVFLTREEAEAKLKESESK